MHHTPWQPIGHTASLRLPGFCAEINLTHPREGLLNVVVAGQRLSEAHLLGIASSSLADAGSAHPVEHYVRGADLVVAYESPSQWPVRVDALWRASAPTAADRVLAMVDLIVSVRASVLDSNPELPVQSAIPSKEVLRLQGPGSVWAPLFLTAAAPKTINREDGVGCLLFRMPDTDLTYVEMVHPADFQRDELSRGSSGSNTLCIAHQLFRTSLEKGVILRARVRGIFVKQPGDTEIAADCYAAFAASEPPLDT